LTNKIIPLKKYITDYCEGNNKLFAEKFGKHHQNIYKWQRLGYCVIITKAGKHIFAHKAKKGDVRIEGRSVYYITGEKK